MALPLLVVLVLIATGVENLSFQPESTDTAVSFSMETVETRYQSVNGISKMVEIRTSYGPGPSGGCLKRVVEIVNGVNTGERYEPVDCAIAKNLVNDHDYEEILKEMGFLERLIRHHETLIKALN